MFFFTLFKISETELTSRITRGCFYHKLELSPLEKEGCTLFPDESYKAFDCHVCSNDLCNSSSIRYSNIMMISITVLITFLYTSYSKK